MISRCAGDNPGKRRVLEFFDPMPERSNGYMMSPIMATVSSRVKAIANDFRGPALTRRFTAARGLSIREYGTTLFGTLESGYARRWLAKKAASAGGVL
jgi:hypothetical protein